MVKAIVKTALLTCAELLLFKLYLSTTLTQSHGGEFNDVR